jgi:two-component system, LuxR family, response regulator FixJ
MTKGNFAIAIVDDDAAVCDSMRFLLETYDFDVQIYQSGAEFLSDGRRDIACLIVDYHMPVLNGLDLVSEMRRRGTQVPTIIMVTATTDPTVETRAAALRIHLVLKKPLSNSVLLDAINAALG